MANVNPGPATTSNSNTVATLTPVNQNAGNFNNSPQAGNALRLIGAARGMSVAVTGDAAVIYPINSASYSVLYVIVTNAQVSGASGSIATSQFGVFTAAAGGGTAVVANAANTSNTGSTVVNQRTVASTATIAGTPLYVNVGTALANGTCDVFIYGFDLS